MQISRFHAEVYGNPDDDVFQVQPLGKSADDRCSSFAQSAGEAEESRTCNNGAHSNASSDNKSITWPCTPKKSHASARDNSISPIKRALDAVVSVLTSPCKFSSSPASERQGTSERSPRALGDLPSSPSKMSCPLPKNLYRTSKGASNLESPSPSPTKRPGRAQHFSGGRVLSAPIELRLKETVRMVEASVSESSISEDTSIPQGHFRMTRQSFGQEETLHSLAGETTNTEISDGVSIGNEKTREAPEDTTDKLGPALRLFPQPPRQIRLSTPSHKLSLGQISTFGVDFGFNSQHNSFSSMEIPAPLFYQRAPRPSSHYGKMSKINDLELAPCDLDNNQEPTIGRVHLAIPRTHQRSPSSSLRRPVRRFQSPLRHSRSTRHSKYQLSIGEISVFECDLSSHQLDRTALPRSISSPSTRFPRRYRQPANTRTSTLRTQHSMRKLNQFRYPTMPSKGNACAGSGPTELVAMHSARRSEQFPYPYMSSNGNISGNYDSASVCYAATLEEEDLPAPIKDVSFQETQIDEWFEEWHHPPAPISFSSKRSSRRPRSNKRHKNGQIQTVFANALETPRNSPVNNVPAPIVRDRRSGIYFGALAEYIKPTRASVVTVARPLRDRTGPAKVYLNEKGDAC